MKNEISYVIRSIKEIIMMSPKFSIYTLINAIISAIMPMIQTILIAAILDRASYVKQGKGSTILVIPFIAYVVSYFVRYVIDIINIYMSKIELENQINSKLKYKLGEHISNIELIEFEKPHIYTRINRAHICINENRMTSLFQVVCIVIPNIFSIIGLILVMKCYSSYLVILALLSVIPSFFSSISANKQYYKLMMFQSTLQRMRDYLWGLCCKKESVREMRIMNFKKFIYDKWITARDKALKEEIMEKGLASWKIFIGDLIRNSFYVVSIFVCIILIKENKLTIGEMGTCLVGFSTLQNTAQYIVASIASVDDNINYIKDYYYVMDLTPKNGTNKGKMVKFDKIAFNNVEFKYPNSNTNSCVIKKLEINKGEKVAIVGENGSGKTTLIKLMLGIYRADKGEILYDEKNINYIDKEELYKKISIVQQNFIQLKTNLIENVDIKNKDIHDKEKILNVLKKAGFDNIGKEDLEKQIGREYGGREFSGGQWQKIAIARSEYKNSELLILDEPTASLDPVLENEILKSYLELSKNKTALVATHRLGICKHTDKVIVLKDNKIVEVGTHKELLKEKGEYFSMWKEQAKWYV